MNSVADQLVAGRRFRVLTIGDGVSREYVSQWVGSSIGEAVPGQDSGSNRAAAPVSHRDFRR